MRSVSIARGDSLTTWALSPVRAWAFQGEPAIAHDPQDYKYINGFVDVGDLPCRVATWREVAGRQVALETDWPVGGVYLPGASHRVAFDQFRYMPTRLLRWCRTRLSAPEDRYCSFELETCGGVHIWVDGVLAARFEPFTRNRMQRTVVHLPIRAGGSEVIVRTEEMAERDTTWSFELRLLDDVRLSVDLPGAEVGGDTTLLEQLSAEVRMRDAVNSGSDPLVLQVDTPPAVDVAIEIKISSMSHASRSLLDRTVVLASGTMTVEICPASELPEGYHHIGLTFVQNGLRLERSIAAAVLHQTTPVPLGDTLEIRKSRALEHAVTHGERRIGTVVALFELGRVDDPRIATILDETLVAIEQRHDCADFVAVPLLWLWHRHEAALPSQMRERIRAALIGFRYWVDEPGSDVMWFWSENHALCFHTAQLLAGLAFPEATFGASGRTGAAQAEIASARLKRWFDSVEHEGLAEWNSSAYYPVDFIGLLALAELAPDPIAPRARNLCDRIFAILALHTLGSVPGGSMGRAYNGDMWIGPLSELAPFAAVAFGTGWLNRGVTSLPLFAAGRYAPPEHFAAWLSPDAGISLLARYLQGFGPAAALTLYKTAHLQLSSNSRSAAGQPGHQQHLLDVRFAGHPMARSWINHPGEDDPWGAGRPGYWAGNGLLPKVGQVGGVALLIYRLAGARIDFAHVCATRSGTNHLLRGDVLVVECGQGRVAYKATGTLVPVTSGPGAGVEYRLRGRHQGFAVLVDDGVGDAEAFATKVAAMPLVLQGDRLTLSHADGRAIALDWIDGLSVDGVAVPEPTQSTPQPTFGL